METQIKNKSIEALKNHLKNIEKISNGEKGDYTYLETCWICGNKIKWYQRIIHSFEGNCHKRCANGNS